MLLAGDEEVQYVVIELGADIDTALLQPGKPLTLTGLDTDAPTLTLGDGAPLQGSYEESLGSLLVFEKGEDSDGQPAAKYVCHTDKKLRFQPAP